jgi:SPP1 gp7 family putative phage head morphogenesis protein
MVWEVTANVDKFDEASDWFRDKTAVTEAEYAQLDDAARARAFRYAGSYELASVQALFDSIADAIDNGTPYDTWRRQVKKDLKSKAPPHLETIFRTNVQTAYTTGRWSQLTNADTLVLRPYWMHDSVLDSRTTELICEPRDGLIKPADDPYWLTSYPPLHFRCRSAVRAIRESEAKRRGGPTAVELGDIPGKGFGLAPPLRDGALPPHGEVTPDPAKHDKGAFSVYQQRQHKAAEDSDEAAKKAAKKRKK